MSPAWRSCRGGSSPICSAPRSHAPTELALEDKAQSALEKAIILLRAHTGHDFSLYKKNTFYRRIERRMGIHQIDKIAGLRPLPAGEPAGAGFAVQGVADRRDEFFPRSRRMGRVAQKDPSGAAGASRPAGHVLRAWVPGCSTGEEAYSLAMVFKEALDKLKPRKRITPADLRHRPGQGRD